MLQLNVPTLTQLLNEIIKVEFIVLTVIKYDYMVYYKIKVMDSLIMDSGRITVWSFYHYFLMARDREISLLCLIKSSALCI